MIHLEDFANPRFGKGAEFSLPKYFRLPQHFPFRLTFAKLLLVRALLVARCFFEVT